MTNKHATLSLEIFILLVTPTVLPPTPQFSEVRGSDPRDIRYFSNIIYIISKCHGGGGRSPIRPPFWNVGVLPGKSCITAVLEVPPKEVKNRKILACPGIVYFSIFLRIGPLAIHMSSKRGGQSPPYSGDEG
jgi:hypothetical protein